MKIKNKICNHYLNKFNVINQQHQDNDDVRSSISQSTTATFIGAGASVYADGKWDTML